MKILFVYGQSNANEIFETSDLWWEKDSLFKFIYNNGGEGKSKVEYYGVKVEIRFKALEFGDVDREFIKFLYYEMFDSDMLKDSKFYIID